VYAGQPGVTLQVEAANPRRGTLLIEPRKLMSFADRQEGTPYGLVACVNDAGVSGRETRLEFNFILSPKIPEGSVYLSDLNPTKAFATAGVKRDEAYLGGEMRLGGLLYRKGLMICPEVTGGAVNFGEAVYSIPPGKFKAVPRKSSASAMTLRRSVVFSVQLRKGRGRVARVVQVEPDAALQHAEGITVPLGDADEIRLYHRRKRRHRCDHACFAGARFEP